MSGRWAPLVGVVGFVGAAVLLTGGPSSGQRPVLRFEDDTGHTIHRDVGLSVPVAAMPGQPVDEHRALWVYGDTYEQDENGDGVGYFLGGTTAAIGAYTPGKLPAPLSHVPTPGEPLTVPNDDFSQASRLVPNPTGLLQPDGSPCVGYQAAWPFGATQGPPGPLTLHDGATPTSPGTPVAVPDAAQLVFLTVLDTCVYIDSPLPSGCAEAETWQAYAPAARWVYEGLRLVAYRPADNTIVASMTPFRTSGGACLPWQQTLLQPVFSGPDLYLQATDCTTYAPAYAACAAGAVATARVPTASLHTPAVYQWKTAAGWSANHEDAVDVRPAPAGQGPVMVDVHDFSAVGEGVLMMEQTSFGGHYNIYEATGPAGPWALRTSGRVKACRLGDATEGCYNLYAHPELSSPGHLRYSYHNRTEGQVRLTDLGAIP